MILRCDELTGSRRILCMFLGLTCLSVPANSVLPHQKPSEVFSPFIRSLTPNPGFICSNLLLTTRRCNSALSIRLHLNILLRRFMNVLRIVTYLLKNALYSNVVAITISSRCSCVVYCKQFRLSTHRSWPVMLSKSPDFQLKSMFTIGLSTE